MLEIISTAKREPKVRPEICTLIRILKQYLDGYFGRFYYYFETNYSFGGDFR